MNFSTAADELCVSQSSLSKQIKSLEDELTVILFNRNKRSISLTDAGLEFSAYAKRIVEEYNDMLYKLREYSPQKKHNICITSIPAMNQYGLTEMITDFQKGHLDINMDISEKDTLQVIKSLENFNTDLVILRTKFLPQGSYKIFPLVDDELVLITDCNHRLAHKKKINLSEAANENFILLSAETCIYDACIEECAKAGFEPHYLRTNIRMDTIKNLVSQGFGVSLFMKRMAEHYADPNIKIIKLEEKPVLTLAIVTRDEKLSSVCSKFINFAVKHFRNMNEHCNKMDT